MLRHLIAWWLILTIFKHYKPRPVSTSIFRRWLLQFPRQIRSHLVFLFSKVIFITEEQAKSALVTLNDKIIEKLAADGIGPEKIIYVQIDTAGSSSPVMLNMLRDTANLSRRGFKFIDSRDMIGLQQMTSEINTGAIIYVDDFSGTGKQFTRNRDWVAQFIIGNFSEFFLAPCICEEAVNRIEKEGVALYYQIIHMKSERPLHPECTILESSIKEEIRDICRKISPKAGLGFEKLATMVVLYRNAPNTVPLLFRGSLGQDPYIGIFPRSDDLPLH